MADTLIPPCGGLLVDLMADEETIASMKGYAGRLPSLIISDRCACDLELLAVGAFSPLDGFMGKEDCQRVLSEMRLVSGQLFPIPVTLPVDPDARIALDKQIVLRNSKNECLAVMTIEQIYPWDRREFAEKVLGTQDERHPLAAEMHKWGKWNIAGKLLVLQAPRRHDFKELRLRPAEVRSQLQKLGRSNVIAFQTQNLLHRAHEELTKRMVMDVGGALLLHPVVGLSKPGDVDHYSRIRTYKAFASRHNGQSNALLALLPLAMRWAGPREALWHAIIQRNYGANYMIADRDYASPGNSSAGEPFYGANDAQEFIRRHEDEIGVRVIPVGEIEYLPEENRFENISKIPQNVSSLPGKQMWEEYLNQGKRLPAWFARPEIAEILSETYPPRHRQGVCVWFTGLSGAGKSTTAEILAVLLLECGRRLTVLDGDVVRTHLSKGLGFSKEDRNANIRRIGFVASEIVRHGGVVLCAAISPYRTIRNEVRNMCGTDSFVEVFVDAPLDVCEARDDKGMYAKARSGAIKDFTGVDDPYEQPINPEIVLNSVSQSAEENSRLVLDYLAGKGFVKPAAEHFN